MEPLTLEVLVAHEDWLRRLAVHLLRDGCEVEDAVQETWAAALRSPPDPRRPIRPWLAQVLRNVIRSNRRSRSRRAAREKAATFAPSGASPEEALARAQLHTQIARLITELEEPYRTTLLLRFYEGLDAASIARACEMPAGTVRWRISEALRQLRERLDLQPGERRTWRAVLAPLALPSSGRKRGAPLRWEVLKPAAIAIGLCAVVQPRTDTGPSPVTALHDRSHSTRTTLREDTTMTNRPIRLAAFVSVALPALAAAAARSSPALEERRVDLDFRNAPIRNVLRLLSDAGRVNIWAGVDVTDQVTIKVHKMPLPQAIDQICQDRALHCQRNGDVVLVSHGELPPPRAYVGKRIEPNFRHDGGGVDIRTAVGTLAEVGQIQIEVDPDVHASVDMKGYSMPWDQILDVIVWTHGLRTERDGDIIRIVRPVGSRR